MLREISNISYAPSVVAERINRLLPENAFEFIITSSNYIFRKPNKRIFDLALEKAELQPDEVWYIGDQYECDVNGSLNAGLLPIWYIGAIDLPYTEDINILTVKDWKGLTLPGGHIEKSESIIDAVIREMKEETGLDIQNPRLCGIKQFPIENGPALIEKWLRNKNTIEFLGIWEEMYNADFNAAAYEEIMLEAGLNRFIMSVKQWVSPQFKLYLIKEFERLKKEEQALLGWSAKRELAKINELICLSNMENINAVLIEDGLNQKERLIKLNKIAIHQMSILEEQTTKILK